MNPRLFGLVAIIAGCGYPLVPPPSGNIKIEESYAVPKAMTVYRNNQFTIYYNPAWMRHRVHPDAQTFVFYHELGHIQLGHLGEGIYLSKPQKYQTELEADCYAGKKLQELHYNPEQIKNVYEFMETEIRDENRLDNLVRCVEE